MALEDREWWWAHQVWRLGRVVWVSDMVSDTFGKGWECWEFPCYSIGRVTATARS